MAVGDILIEIIFLNVHEELDRLCLTPDNLKTESTPHWRNLINILVSNNNNMQMANWR